MDERERKARQELRGSWAGETLLDHLVLAEMRAITRAHLATDEVTRTALAREIGISRHHLDSFLSGNDLSEPTWAKMAAWVKGRPTPSVAPETVALDVLSRWAQTTHAHTARAQIARCVRELYAVGLEKSLPSAVLQALDVY
jgi:hypothetical protein